jgi:acetyltransferase-like isoleucine patch superfamily enzyme
VHVYSATNTLIHPQHPGQTTSLSHVSPEEFQHIAEAPVEIADYVVVGFSSLVLPGVSLGQAAVVHPYAIVSKSFPAFANITGPGRARQNGWRRPPKLDPRRLQNE